MSEEGITTTAGRTQGAGISAFSDVCKYKEEVQRKLHYFFVFLSLPSASQ